MPLRKKKIKKAKTHHLKTSISKTKKRPIKKIKKSTAKIIKKKPALKKADPQQEIVLVIGKITHYFPHVKAAVIPLKKELFVGDNLYIKGRTTDFKQTTTSIQIDHVAVKTAKPGDEIGLFVKSKVRIGDTVYKV